MYALIKENKFTGTVYNDLRQEFIEHAEKYNLQFAEIKNPLNFDKENNILTEPTQEEINAGEKQVVKFKLEQLDKKYSSDRSWREFVLKNSEQFPEQVLEKMQEAETTASELRLKIKK